MSITNNHRKTMDGNRDALVELMTSTLNILKGTDVSAENREILVNDAKNTLDTYIKLETTSNQYEYIMGRLAGLMLGLAVPIIGLTMCKGVKKLFVK